ncbi:hypothetical protein C0581_03130 [Candidatus Parcubacteria bacterium]|nr:MAG: hypothetical protein C0581_03130 [Candidatus Parcubacteria bacterium]
MKKIIFLLFITLFITGCGKEEPEVKMMEQNSEEIKKVEIISGLISQALAENQNLNYIENAAIDQLPEGIDKNQIPKTHSDDITKLYAFKNVAFMFVNHGYTEDTWGGILAKEKGSTEWIKLLPTPKEKHDPSTMSVKDGKLYLSIEENSPVIHPISFFTTDGINWEEEN